MAEKAKTTIFRDPVSEAAIIKGNIRKVTKNQIEYWPSRWEWIIAENQKMYDAMEGKRPLSPYDWSRWYGPPNPLPRLPDAGKDKDGKPKKRPLAIYLPAIPDGPQQRPDIPETSSGWYGFLPKVQGRSLVSERQRWCKRWGQYTIIKQLEWPKEFD